MDAIQLDVSCQPDKLVLSLRGMLQRSTSLAFETRYSLPFLLARGLWCTLTCRYFVNVVEQRFAGHDNVLVLTHEPIWLLEWYLQVGTSD